MRFNQITSFHKVLTKLCCAILRVLSLLEPQNYVAGRAEDYFKSVYTDYENYKSQVGISALMNDSKFNLVPEDLQRLDRREKYQEDQNHSSLKDKREKRDELKEKKFKAQQQKSTGLSEQETDKTVNE